MVKVDKLTNFDYILVCSQPYFHTVDHNPPRIAHKLPRSNTKETQQLHYERVDGEPKPAGKSCLVEAYFTRKEVAGLILIGGPTNMNTLWELEPVLEPTHGLVVQPTYFLKGVKSPNYPWSRDDCISPLRVTARRQPCVQFTRLYLCYPSIFPLKPSKGLTQNRGQLSYNKT